MIYEVKRSNSSALYEFFKKKGYSKTIFEFNEELFDLKNNEKEVFLFSKTFVSEVDKEVVAFIQYGRTENNKGLIRLFYSEEGYENLAKNLLFKATSYFYMFHIKEIKSFEEEYRIGQVNEGIIKYSNIEHLFDGLSFNFLKAIKFLKLSY